MPRDQLRFAQFSKRPCSFPWWTETLQLRVSFSRCMALSITDKYRRCQTLRRLARSLHVMLTCHCVSVTDFVSIIIRPCRTLRHYEERKRSCVFLPLQRSSLTGRLLPLSWSDYQQQVEVGWSLYSVVVKATHVLNLLRQVPYREKFWSVQIFMKQPWWL